MENLSKIFLENDPEKWKLCLDFVIKSTSFEECKESEFILEKCDKILDESRDFELRNQIWILLQKFKDCDKKCEKIIEKTLLKIDFKSEEKFSARNVNDLINICEFESVQNSDILLRMFEFLLLDKNDYDEIRVLSSLSRTLKNSQNASKFVLKLLEKDKIMNKFCACSEIIFHRPEMIINNELFWSQIYHGLGSKDHMIRKRSLYLLKRTLDLTINSDFR